MTTHVSRGTYGDFSPRHGDLTGNQHLRLLADKEDRVSAVTHTINSLRSDPVVIVPERGGASWAVPRHVYDLILAAAKIEDR